MKLHAVIPAVVAALYLVVLPAGAPAEDKAADAREIVERAGMTFDRFMHDKDFTIFHENIAKAKGILIFPQVLKAGWIWGGSGGAGVLVVRDAKTQAWTQPAFYIVGSVSFGLQIGAETAEVVMLAMSRKAIDSLMTSSFKLGGNVSVAAGPRGAGVKKTLTADFLSFSRTKGLYAGLDFEGSVMKVADNLNRSYYGRDARPVQILVEHDVRNPYSDRLLSKLPPSP